MVVNETSYIYDKTPPGLEQNSKAAHILKISDCVKWLPPFEGPKLPPSF